jgi:DMSO/TMAO reductase YedYZ molybdopterin-dependent catalytic subunit
MGPTMLRRDWLKAASAAALPLALGRAAVAQDVPAKTFPGMIVRMNQPRNLEYPFSELKDFVTPKGQFYVRSHFAEPEFDVAGHTVTVEGEVENPLTMSPVGLKALGEVTMPLTLECAGNNRVFLSPASGGLQWGQGAVSTANWTGVPVAALLERAKVKPGASHVILVGVDKGALGGDFPTPGVIHYDRGIPLAKLTKPECLLATAMNGEPLPAQHGGPLRAVLGGWYGMASVKWLSRVIVTSQPHDGFWQTKDYSYFERRHGLPYLFPVTTMQPKASIARPSFADALPVGKPVTVAGAAWAGDDPLDRVEFSSDGGKTWAAVRFTTPARPFCWRLWEVAWTPTTRGPAKLLARATTAGGQTQPATRDPDRRAYMINHLVPVEVVVR